MKKNRYGRVFVGGQLSAGSQPDEHKSGRIIFLFRLQVLGAGEGV
ncbi:MAG TPA: hypothetical protein VH878_10240 [Thermodesulfobacteriota bacterium]